MSNKAETRFLEDRAMRDSARAMVDADFDLVKSELKATNLAKRTAIRVKEGASEIYEEASETVSENKVLFSALLGAAVILIASKPIFSMFTGRGDGDGADRQDGITPDMTSDETTYEVTVADSAAELDEKHYIVEAE